jgi:hypothetical protein
MEIKLNGVTAVIGVAALVLFGAYRMSSMQTELETEALDELKAFLSAEYAGSEVTALSESLDSEPQLDTEQTPARVERILAAQKITFPSVSARGFWDANNGGEAVVRVEIQVDGGPPPDGVTTRYYRMRYRPLSGWTVRGRTSVWSYRLKLF